MVLPKVLRKCFSSQKLRGDVEASKTVSRKQDMSGCQADQSCSSSSRCQCMCELCVFGHCQLTVSGTGHPPHFSATSQPSMSWDPSVSATLVSTDYEKKRQVVRRSSIYNHFSQSLRKTSLQSKERNQIQRETSLQLSAKRQLQKDPIVAMLNPDSQGVSKSPPFLTRAQTSPASLTRGVEIKKAPLGGNNSFLPRLGRSDEILDLTQDTEKMSMSTYDGEDFAGEMIDRLSLDGSEPDEDNAKVYALFMKEHHCYDLIPTSSKLVVFDIKLPVKKAFYALVANGLRSAPLWNSELQKFIGMLTISDFINILNTYYKSPTVKMHELEEHLIETWRNGPHHSKLISIEPNSSLYDGLKQLVKNKIHRLPIMEVTAGNPLYILTHKRILKFLYLFINELPKPAFMDCTLGELRIGTYDRICTVTGDTPIIEALRLFVENRVSALPVVNSVGKVVDIYAKFDVINLAVQRSYNNLDVTVKQALAHRPLRSPDGGVLRCYLCEKMSAIVKRVVEAEVHRLVVVNSEDHVIGIVSLSDLLSFMVLRPCGDA